MSCASSRVGRGRAGADRHCGDRKPGPLHRQRAGQVLQCGARRRSVDTGIRRAGRGAPACRPRPGSARRWRPRGSRATPSAATRSSPGSPPAPKLARRRTPAHAAARRSATQPDAADLAGQLSVPGRVHPRPEPPEAEQGSPRHPHPQHAIRRPLRRSSRNVTPRFAARRRAGGRALAPLAAPLVAEPLQLGVQLADPLEDVVRRLLLAAHGRGATRPRI